MENSRKVNPSNLMTVSDFAKSKGVTRQAVYHWIREKKLNKIQFLGKSFVDKSTFIK